MREKITDWIVCPLDGADLRVLNAQTVDHDGCTHIAEGELVCEHGHVFPIRNSVPRLRPEDVKRTNADEAEQATETTRAAKAIAASFGREWTHFDHEHSRTWHDTLEERRALFLREVDLPAEAMRDKLVLDAGCGNGSLSWGISEYDCDVLAADVSDAVDVAHKCYAMRPGSRVHYVQADLSAPPFRPATYDVVFSSGVLHHNPDTLAALKAIAPAIKPGGRIYIWLYHKEPGLKFALQLKLRSIISPLPAPIKHGFVYVWSIQSMIRQHLRTLLRLNDERDRLTWKERIVDLMDIYTPRYRHMHTQDEVTGWYNDLGLTDITTTEVRDWGFGMKACRPTSTTSTVNAQTEPVSAAAAAAEQ